ncbi:MAG TPA: hypothetical protein IAD10_09055, partial [Candidatus Fimicola cottocaccae]|nr:hypothetical protein [Candidatus Fimicola cottocaccae]
MKVSEMMTGIEPNPSYTGPELPDNTIVAINITGEDTTIDNFTVFRQSISSIEENFEQETEEESYYYDGTSTTITDVKYSLNITGKRYKGDAAQDKLTTVESLFATGQKAIYEGIVLDINTGVGLACLFSIAVNKRKGGEKGGGKAPFEATLSKTGPIPVEFNYSTDKGKTFSEVV